ncbi:MAG TPA: phosphoribosylaminoimidazolesuccinocarboxamide synthase [Gemmatimonadales bacterium]|nr:phosphoribosylaminoimidazolesuccinocarboxamide synthase [Gemmatimonadales bacterium]
MTATLKASALPLPLFRRGKVREVYEVDDQRLLIVTSDRISAFDVVLADAIPHKGRVLTQVSAHWFAKLSAIVPSHFITVNTDEIVAAVPSLDGYRDQIEARSMLVRRTEPVAFECVVRGYLTGSAWLEYQQGGTLAGEPLPAGMLNASRLEPPLFSPATKAVSGHDENVSFERMSAELGDDLAGRLREISLALYAAGRNEAAARGLIIADTKFEFGLDSSGEPLLIDEVLTPDSSRFWLACLVRQAAAPGLARRRTPGGALER